MNYKYKNIILKAYNEYLKNKVLSNNDKNNIQNYISKLNKIYNEINASINDASISHTKTGEITLNNTDILDEYIKKINDIRNFSEEKKELNKKINIIKNNIKQEFYNKTEYEINDFINSIITEKPSPLD